MLNLATSSESKDNLIHCMIDLDRTDPCYFAGDKFSGRLNIKLSTGFIEIRTLKICLQGIGKISGKGKKEDTLIPPVIYIKKEWNIITTSRIINDLEYSFPFEEHLPDTLPSSFWSPKGHILYSVTSQMEYINNDGQPNSIKAVRGLTVIEELDLNKISKTFFEPRAELELRKFGWFTCTGGQIKLSLNFDRTAFVCGEGMIVTGRLENKSEKKIEKVNAVLQRIIKYSNDAEEESDSSFVDYQEIQEDILAMYVETGSSIKIDKKPTMSPCVPTTPVLELFEKKETIKEENPRFLRRKSHMGGRMSISSQRSRTSISSLPVIRRIMTVSYKYVVKVKSGGVDVIEIVVPILIGSHPLADTETEETRSNKDGKDSSCGATFRMCKTDKPIALLDEKEHTLCNKAQLQHTNKYPIYSDLTTSSKQGKKMCLTAGKVMTENQITNAMRHGLHSHARQGSQTISTSDLPEISDISIRETDSPILEINAAKLMDQRVRR